MTRDNLWSWKWKKKDQERVTLRKGSTGLKLKEIINSISDNYAILWPSYYQGKDWSSR